MKHDDQLPLTSRKSFIITLVLLALCILYYAISQAQWKYTTTYDWGRIKGKRLDQVGGTTYNGDEVLMLTFSNGKTITIRARQSRLIVK